LYRGPKEKAPTDAGAISTQQREDNYVVKSINNFLFREPITFHLLIRFMNKPPERRGLMNMLWKRYARGTSGGTEPADKLFRFSWFEWSK
jgi:hypothetical protein